MPIPIVFSLMASASFFRFEGYYIDQWNGYFELNLPAAITEGIWVVTSTIGFNQIIYLKTPTSQAKNSAKAGSILHLY